MIVNRSRYIDQLVRSKGNGLIKIITGLRRSGKSFLLKKLFRQHLLDEGVSEDHIIIIDMESRKNKDFKNPDYLLDWVEKEMKDDTLMNILFDYSGNEYCFVVFFEKKGIGKIPMSLDFYRQTESRYVRQLTARSGDDFEKIDVEWAGNIILNRQ